MQAVPPIKYGLGYRSQTLTLNPNLNPKTDLTLTLKVTKMYAVQNDTRIKFNIELYISYFRRAGGGYTKGLPRKVE